MARKALEMTIELGGRVSSSLGNAFQRATGNIDDLRDRSRAAQRELNRLGNEFRQGRITQSQYAEATERITREMRQLENAQKRVQAFSGTLNAGFNSTKAVASIAAVSTATAASAAAMKSIDTAADFEAQMSAVKAKTQATGAEMKALNQTALQLGASTSLSASEVGGAMDELASKGFDAGKIIGAMPGIIAGAEASGEDLALVSDVVTSAINSYGFAAEDASRIADIMAMSANKTAAGVYDLGQSFKYASPVAKTLGIEFEELTAATGILVDKGLAGEQAGTALRMSLIRLSDPPTEAAKALKKLNISAVDSNNKFKSLAQISGEWNKATEKLTAAQKVQYASTVFGSEAATAMLNIFDAGPEKIQEMTKELKNSAGASAEAAAVMKDNFAGAKSQFFGAIESGQIAFATPILDVLKDTFQGLTGIIDDNMSGIGILGEKVAGGMRDILDPFATMKPELTPEIRHDPEAFKAYEKELAKFTMFDGMDFSDKVIYSLDETIEKMEAWLGGSGGEAMGEIFSKLGEIAFKAWSGAFTGALKATGSNIMEGNIGGALGMGTAAWMLGGGLMVKGAVGAGKWGKDIYTSKKAAASTAMSAPTIGPAQTAKITPRTPTATASAPAKTIGSTGKTSLSTASKVASKAMLPLGIAMEGYNIYKSEDKTKATSEAAGGLAGGLGAAKLGAALGTAVAPGIGTAIGGALGGAFGYFGGKWAGGKAVDTVRGDNNVNATSAPSPIAKTGIASAQPYDATQINNSATALVTTLTTTNTNFMNLNTQVGLTQTTMTTSFNMLQTNTDMLANNMQLLASYTGQASGWLVGGLSGIQSAGQRVVTALNNLETRINNVQLPGEATSRRLQYE